MKGKAKQTIPPPIHKICSGRTFRPRRQNAFNSRFAAFGMEIRRGIAVSPGLAIGPALVLDNEGVLIRARTVSADEVEQEIARLKVALRAAVTASKARQKSLSVKLGAGVAE